MTASTPISRVAAFAAAAEHRRPGTIHIDRVTRNGQSHDLTLDDLNAVLAIHEECCPSVEHCEGCNTVLCATHGLGEAADCAADRIHCTSPWCYDQACMDAHDHLVQAAVQAAENIDPEACET